MTEAAGRITLWGVEVFVAAAEEGSVTAAARRLDASVATVSQQLTKLEVSTGTTLLDRSSRPMRLTPAGEMFLRRANAILNEADQARAELAQANFSELTRFRLGMIEDFDADVTPRLLAAMAEELTRCQFLLETGASHRLLDQLESRALDLVVAATPGTVPEGMEAHPILTEPFVAAAPRGWSAESLIQKPLIQYTSRHMMGRQIAAHLQQEAVSLPQRFELDSYHAILAMVAEGAGWAILTPLGYRRAQRFLDRVTLHPLPLAPLSRSLSLITRRDILGDMPEGMAARLRGLATDLIIAPLVAEHPWLGESFRVSAS